MFRLSQRISTAGSACLAGAGRARGYAGAGPEHGAQQGGEIFPKSRLAIPNVFSARLGSILIFSKVLLHGRAAQGRSLCHSAPSLAPGGGDAGGIAQLEALLREVALEMFDISFFKSEASRATILLLA